MKPRIVFASLLLSHLLVGLNCGCSKRETPVERATRENILLMGNPGEAETLDPHLVRGMYAGIITTSLMEGLGIYHPTDDTLPEPGVAEHWSHSDDFRTWTFHLRDNARWSNGDPVVAGDFVYSYKRMLSPALGAEFADMLYVLHNAEAYHQGEIEDFDLVGAKALDDHTLELRLEYPMPNFLNMLKHFYWLPVHPATIEKFGKIDSRLSTWTRPENYVGNGPFRLKEHVTNKGIIIEKSPTYWDADTVQLKEVHFLPFDRHDAEERAFRAGQIHYVSRVPINKIDFYLENYPELIHIDDYVLTYFYRLNVTRWPLTDERVRQALSLAIDRESLIKNVSLGRERPAHGYTPDGTAGYSTPQEVEYNPEKARALLEEAGFPNGKGFPTMDILYNTSETHKVVAEAIQQMWRKNLNLNFTLSNQEWKVYLNSQRELNYDVSRSAWVAGYIDPMAFLYMWTSDNGNNNTGWSNPHYDALIKKAYQTSDIEQRHAYLQQAETILLQDMPMIPLYWTTRIYIMSPDVKNWNPKLLDNRPLKYIYLESS